MLRINKNYMGSSLFDENSASGSLKNQAGRYISCAQSYPNGVVKIEFNDQFERSSSDNTAGAVDYVSSLIARKELFFAPFYAIEDSTNPAPFLR